jgi:hypothetical protein
MIDTPEQLAAHVDWGIGGIVPFLAADALARLLHAWRLVPPAWRAELLHGAGRALRWLARRGTPAAPAPSTQQGATMLHLTSAPAGVRRKVTITIEDG